MFQSRKIISIVMAIGLFSTILPLVAMAQSETVKAALQEVSDISKENDIDSLAGRREALLKMLELSSLEIEDLAKKIRGLENLAETYEDLRTALLQNLNNYSIYLNDLEQLLSNEDLSKDELKSLAGDFKKWREGQYDTILKKSVNFIWILRETDLLTMAGNRLNKISTDLKKIRPSRIIKTGNLLSSLERATRLYTEAKQLNERAQELLLATDDQLIDNDDPSLEEIIEITLEKIKATYQEFFRMNSLLKEMLGL